jgi:hypothetical protein
LTFQVLIFCSQHRHLGKNQNNLVIKDQDF